MSNFASSRLFAQAQTDGRGSRGIGGSRAFISQHMRGAVCERTVLPAYLYLPGRPTTWGCTRYKTGPRAFLS